MILIDRLVIASCYLFLFSLPLGLEGSFKLIFIIHWAVFLKALGITFVMCFLMIISFYLLKIASSKLKAIYTKCKVNLYEVAYPLNLKHAFFHFLILIIYILSIRNGIAHCMITEEDISKIDSVIKEIEKGKEIIIKNFSGEDLEVITQAQKVIVQFGEKKENIINGELNLYLIKSINLSLEQKKAIYNMVENLFKVIMNNYTDDLRRLVIAEDGSIINKGIITKGEHKGKFFMEVIAGDNKYWLIAKNKEFYQELCLKFFLNCKDIPLLQNLQILREKYGIFIEDFPNFMEKIKEKVVSIKQLMIEEKNQKIESPKELVIDEKITQTSTITNYSGDNQEINKLQNKIKELNVIIDNKNKIIDDLVAQSEPNQTINQISNKTAPMNTEDLNIESLKNKIKELNAVIENKTKIIDDLCLNSDSSKLIVNKELQIEELNKKLNNARLEHDLLQNQLNRLDREVSQEMKNLNNHLEEQNDEMKKIKRQLAQKNLGNKWLKIQLEKNNLINQGHYQYMAMGAMGMGIAVTGSYLLSKCI